MTGQEFQAEGFEPDIFFNMDFQGLNPTAKASSECPPPPNIYAPDWNEISRKYKKLKNYQCEGVGCPHIDLSSAPLKKYLHCHHVDRDKQHNTFFNLKALCIYCHSKQPQHNHMRNNSTLRTYLQLIDRDDLS